MAGSTVSAAVFSAAKVRTWTQFFKGTLYAGELAQFFRKNGFVG